MEKLRQYASNQTWLKFAMKVLRRWPNASFRKYVSAFEFSPEYPQKPRKLPQKNGEKSHAVYQSNHRVRNLQVHELGDKNPGKIIMLMNNRIHHGGFCGMWIYYLNRLAFSDKMGFYHVFNCDQSDFYMEDHPMHGTKNVFEYYFQQPCGISLKSARKSKSVILDWNSDNYGYNEAFHVGGNTDYTYTDKDIEQFALLQKKYIKLQPSIEKKINRQLDRLIGGCKAVAVHARGTDYKIEYKGHPIPITTQDYIDTARTQLERIGAERVFLATDDLTILEQFKEAFGDKLVYYDDVIRSEDTVWNCHAETNVRNHHYRLGFEIVRDVYTMASCDSFVCGMSYVSFVVQVIKKAQDREFETLTRLFYGLRKDGLDLTDSRAREEVEKKWELEMKNKREREQKKDSDMDLNRLASPLQDQN